MESQDTAEEKRYLNSIDRLYLFILAGVNTPWSVAFRKILSVTKTHVEEIFVSTKSRPNPYQKKGFFGGCPPYLVSE